MTTIELSTTPAPNPSRLYGELPLPPSRLSIRLLHLKRIRESPTTLEGSLRVVALDESPRFTTLSYTWMANSTDTLGAKIIKCNNVDLQITKNCHDALSSLSRLYAPMDIWVDAICINQNDEEEKNLQIKQMTDIYTWAKTGYIWLGLGNDRTDKAIECLRHLSQFRISHPGVPWTKERRKPTLIYEKASLTMEFIACYMRACIPLLSWLLNKYELPEAFNLVDLHELLGGPWAKRAWTFQEIVFSPNPIIICGPETISWSRFQTGLEFLNDPILPLRMSFSGLLRASFTFKGPITPTSQSSHPIATSCRSIKSFHTWRSLYLIWTLAGRPSEWNGEKLRTFPSDDTNTEESKTWCVARYRQQFIDFPKAWHRVRLAIALLNSIVAGVFFIPVAFIQSHPDPEAPTTIPQVLLSAACIVLAWTLLTTIYSFRVTPISWDDSGGESELLIGIIQALRERQATRAADKAFALHSVLKSIGISPTDPDLTQNVGTVYQGLFYDLLCRNTSLINLLIDVNGPEAFANVPSWVPDWRSSHQNDWNQSEFIYDHTDLYGMQFPRPQMKISKDKLGLWAIRKGIISEAFPRTPVENLRLAHSFAQQISHVCEHAPGSISRTEPEKEYSMYQHLYKALTGKTFVPEDGGPVIEILKRWMDLSREPALIHTQLSSTLHQNQELWQFLLSCYRPIPNRVMFITAGLYGTGPPRVEAGDQLTWLRGVAVPMILRESESNGNEFEVVGPALVPGLMDLSGFNGAENGDDREIVYLV